MRTMIRSFGTLLLASAVTLACRSAGNDDATKPATPAAGQPADTTQMRVTGTVRAVGIEGGCWRFDADDGRHFEISRSGVPDGLLQDGKQATLELRARPDLMSTCMIGPIVEVVKVES
jgi:hypothetical protein